MWILIDLIVVALIALIAIISAFKGFVRSAVEVVGLIAAVIIAVSVGSPVAGFGYDTYIEPAIVSAAESAASDSGEKTVDAVWDMVPDFVTANSESFGISKENVDNIFVENASQTISEAAKKASAEIVRPIFVRVVGMFVSAVLFVILIIVVQILAKLLNKIFSFSILGKINRTLGALIGFVQGVLLAIIICSFISDFSNLLVGSIIDPATISQTYIFKFFAAII